MKKLRVLVIDDSKLVLKMTAAALSQAGFDVLTASSLTEFDQLLTTNQPDIILTDVKMPEISGDDICRVLKHKLHTKSIPVVFFSTLEETELAQLAQRAGADGYVCKGSGIEEIVKSIERLTEEVVF